MARATAKETARLLWFNHDLAELSEAVSNESLLCNSLCKRCNGACMYVLNNTFGVLLEDECRTSTNRLARVSCCHRCFCASEIRIRTTLPGF
eukprot:6179969-Pleurochrysis_carterae.AAC.2